MDHLNRSIDDSNQYIRRDNLIIDGLDIGKNSTNSDIRKAVSDAFQEVGLNLSESDVVRAHRTGCSFVDKKGKQHTPIICRFATWQPRNLVFSNQM